MAIDDRIREDLARAVDGVRPAGRLEEVTSADPTPPAGHRRVLAVCLVAVLLAGGATVAVALSSGGSGKVRVTEPNVGASSPSTAQSSTTGVRVPGRALPTDAPAVAPPTIPRTGATTPSTAGSDADGECSSMHPSVTEADAGGVVEIEGVTDRFPICLDEARHPVRRLDTTDCPFGYVSNLSLRGPDSYPIGFEATAVGSCTVRDGDFRVRIVVTGGTG
jgi:hypothetical protein